MTEAQTERAWCTPWVHLPDRRLHILWVEGLVHLTHGALEGSGGALGSAEIVFAGVCVLFSCVGENIKRTLIQVVIA